MKKFLVSYKIYGSVGVEANTKKEAEEKIEIVSDRELIEGLSMDGDDIEVYTIDEV